MTLFAKEGEWVSSEEGQRVCRVSRDLYKYERVDPKAFSEWQGKEPAIGEHLPSGFRTNGLGGMDLHIEGVGWASDRKS